MPWYLGVLVGPHFLPFAWLYGSRAYLFASAATTAAASPAGWILPALAFVAPPSAVAAVLLLTSLLLWREAAADRVDEPAPDAEEMHARRGLAG